MKRLLFLILLLAGCTAAAQTPPEIQVREPGFQVFQFPRTAIPRIDGDFSDWEIVPDSYAVGIDQMWDDTGAHAGIDRSTLDIRVKVGWVEGPAGKARQCKVWEVCVRDPRHPSNTDYD